jgi:plastocyanin
MRLRPPSASAFALSLLAAASARAQHASTVSGEVRRATVRGDEPVALAVVLLEPEGDAAKVIARPPAPRLDQVWLSFVPKVQVVRPGATLRLDNRDDESHTVHAWFDGATLFNLATAPSGQPVEAPLDRPGVVEITCDIHDEMHAFIVVSRSPLAAVADRDGRFVLDGVPPGRYRVRVWSIPAGRTRLPAGIEPGEVIAHVALPSPRPIMLRLTPAD